MFNLMDTWEARDAKGKFLIRVAANSEAEAVRTAHIRGKKEATHATRFVDEPIRK